MGNQREITRLESDGFSGGFTIIEVILFLAISGLLLGVAIATISANINNSRFNDAIRSTTSYLQRQYSEVAAGQSDRKDAITCDSSGQVTTGTPRPLGMTDCVVMGRFIKLEGTKFTVRYITGYRASLVGISADDTAAVMQMNPRVAGTIAYEGEYGVPWGITLVNTRLTGVPSPSPSTGFAIIRSPASGNILYYTEENITSSEPVLDAAFINAGNLNRTAQLCFADNSTSRAGRININNGQGQEIIQTDLATQGSCP